MIARAGSHWPIVDADIYHRWHSEAFVPKVQRVARHTHSPNRLVRPVATAGWTPLMKAHFAPLASRRLLPTCRGGLTRTVRRD